MTNSEFQFIIEGADRETAARELSRLLAEEFATEPRRVLPAETSADQPTRGVDPVAVGALVLAIPAAVLAAVDVVQRIKKKKQIGAFLEKAGQITQTTTVKIRITTPKGEQFEFERVQTAQLLDSAVTQKKF